MDEFVHFSEAIFAVKQGASTVIGPLSKLDLVQLRRKLSRSYRTRIIVRTVRMDEVRLIVAVVVCSLGLLLLRLWRDRQHAHVARERARRRVLALENQQKELEERAERNRALQVSQAPKLNAETRKPLDNSQNYCASAETAEVSGQLQRERVASEEKRLELARRSGLLSFLPALQPSVRIASLAPTLRALTLMDAKVQDDDIQCLSQVVFRSLSTLDLSGNFLSRLWSSSSPWQVPALERLNVSRNSALAALPASGWGCVDKLKELQVSACALTCLPPNLAHLPALRLLDASGNKLRRLPPELGALCALKDLDLSSNLLESLPAAWQGMTQLRRLNVEHNLLTRSDHRLMCC